MMKASPRHSLCSCHPSPSKMERGMNSPQAKKGVRIWILVFLFVFFSVISASAVEVGGYYENDLIGVVKRGGGGLVGDVNKLRLKIDSKISENSRIHLEPEYDSFIKSENLPLVSNLSGLDQLSWDRAYIKTVYSNIDITLGKQRIAWGTGYIWNPTDALNPFTLSFAVSEEDEEDEIAARFEIALGEADGIDAFIIGGKKWGKSIKAIKRKTNIHNYDWSISYVDLGEKGFQFGFDFAGDLLDLGVRSEIAIISPSNANRYIKSSWGGDYTFENGWYMNVEYFFNAMGEKKRENYDWDSYLAGDINQLGVDYFYFGCSKMLDELTTIRLSCLMNADDLSNIVYPAISYNMTENIDLSLEAMFSGGESGSEYMPTDQIDPSGFMGSRIVFVKWKYTF
jgi:hypothetical protein